MIESSLLLDETRNKIRTLMLDGKNIKEILAIMNIPAGTWDTYYWRNQKGFRDFVNGIELEQMKLQARKNLREVASMDIPLDDPRWLKIKTDVSQFIAETLDKDNFSKKQEVNDSQPITINVNSLKDRLPEPIDTQPKVLQSDVAQYTLEPKSDSGNTTTQIDNDVKQLTDTVKPDVI